MTTTAASSSLTALAATLDRAQTTATATTQLTSTTDLTLQDAYAIQHMLVGHRITRGDTVSGVKLGFTSRAKAQQMGVGDVIIGSITAAMQVLDGGDAHPAAYIHPRIEPEVAWLLGRDIDLDHDASTVSEAVAAVAPALEIIDSRYRDFRFTLQDVVADNTSAAGYVIGPWQHLDTAGDLANRGVILEVNGHVTQTGSTAAILGHPYRALAAARRLAKLHGFTLRAGMVLLAGAATAAVPLSAGAHVQSTVTGLGRVGVQVEPGGVDHG
jgi:2-oxo-3-hexenedioate decarboxylase